MTNEKGNTSSTAGALDGLNYPHEEREAFLTHGSSADDVRKAESSSGSRDRSSAAARRSSPHARHYSTTLHRSSYILVLVILYTALALTSWVLLCLLTFIPLTTKHYAVDIHSNYNHVTSLIMRNLYIRSEHIFRAARIIQAIASVLTIPLTSAVCSKAAVVFVQQRRQRLGFSLRQLMVLADKGWTDPEVIWRLICAGWKRYGSSFLYLAILLHILGKDASRDTAKCFASFRLPKRDTVEE